MSTIELKNELHKIIDESDSNFVQEFYEIIKGVINKSENIKMIEESEKDIIAGRIHSLEEVKNSIKLDRKIKPVYFTTRAHKDLEKITKFNILLLGIEIAISISYVNIICFLVHT